MEVKNGKEYIKAPCGNCKAMGEVNLYGRVPFEKYDGMPVNQAIEKHVGNANAARCRADLVATLTSAENVTMDTDERGMQYCLKVFSPTCSQILYPPF